MASWLPAFVLAVLAAAAPVETRFVQVAPSPQSAAARKDRAVILLNGLHLYPFRAAPAAKAIFAPWQEADSTLVRTLAADADVYSFAYGQGVTVTEIAALPDLAAGVRHLRELGYREVVLVGFSAGGLVARQFVEDVPNAGVTKVVQVCAPNGGSSWAKLSAGAPSGQEAFVQSLCKEARTRWQLGRRDRPIPSAVQFVCIVGTGTGNGDGIVATRSQWTDDLQRQGVPAVVLHTEHLRAVRTVEGAKLIARLVRDEQPRWDADEVAAMRRYLWGSRADRPE